MPPDSIDNVEFIRIWQIQVNAGLKIRGFLLLPALAAAQTAGFAMKSEYTLHLPVVFVVGLATRSCWFDASRDF